MEKIELLNWPPSRGEDNPYEPSSVGYFVGEVARCDVERENNLELDLVAMKRQKATEPLTGKFYCNYHIATVATLTVKQAHLLLDVLTEEPDSRSGEWWRFKPEPIKTRIDYPLALAVELVIKPLTVNYEWKDGRTEAEDYLSPGYLMWVVAQEYLRIYQEHEKYGVWGHPLSDLHFEGFHIEDGFAQLLIGS